MTHPLINQLRFTRQEFLRSVKGVSEAAAKKRILPMNCLSWNVGHLAWQEQRYFLIFAQGQMPFPEINEMFAYGAPASEPSLKEVLAAWKAITAAADPWLNTLTPTGLQQAVVSKGKPTDRLYGNLLQRTIYHYWYHTGENMAIRQLLGHERLPQFVGDIDSQAPYRPEAAATSNRSMPPGVIIPELAYPDIDAAAAWLCHTFGFQERLRIGSHRAQLVYGQESVIVVERSGKPPDDAPPMTHALMVQVADVDGHYAHAQQAGAQILSPPETYPYGERQYAAADLGGHVWTFSQSVADVAPETWGGQLVTVSKEH